MDFWNFRLLKVQGGEEVVDVWVTLPSRPPWHTP